MWRLALVFVVVIVTGGIGYWWLQQTPPEPEERTIPGTDMPFTVEVLNGTNVDGLARATTRHLRAAGIDVVRFGTASADTFSVTQILVRRSDTTGAARVRASLGFGTVILDEDARLLLDVSVYLGRDASGLVGIDP